MRILVTAFAYLGSLAVIGAGALFIVLVFAGPHSNVLPGWLQAVVLALAWIVIVILPLLAARQVWRRFAPATAP